jgi:hypothetical protein
MNPFDTSAGLAAHARLPAGQQHRPLVDDTDDTIAAACRNWREQQALLAERAARRKEWARVRRERFAAEAKALGMTKLQYRAHRRASK